MRIGAEIVSGAATCKSDRIIQGMPGRIAPGLTSDVQRAYDSPQGARRRLQESGRSFDIYKHRA